AYCERQKKEIEGDWKAYEGKMEAHQREFEARMGALTKVLESKFSPDLLRENVKVGYAQVEKNYFRTEKPVPKELAQKMTRDYELVRMQIADVAQKTLQSYLHAGTDCR